MAFLVRSLLQILAMKDSSVLNEKELIEQGKDHQMTHNAEVAAALKAVRRAKQKNKVTCLARQQHTITSIQRLLRACVLARDEDNASREIRRVRSNPGGAGYRARVLHITIHHGQVRLWQ